MQTNKNSKLTLIGAGPGDPELLTIKAAKALAEADVILYDALVNKEILSFAPTAEQIFVGKRKGCYAYQQDQINELIVSRALSHGHVVRLKGGDPFVFGRGAEEMEYAANFGIETELVPGISSSLAVPALQNIPVTKRGASESFWVITGTTKDHKLSKDVRLAAQSTATVVILMGMSKLNEIVNEFKMNDRSDTPVAIIQNGTCYDEEIVVGTVDDIAQRVGYSAISNPAVIIIGEVVNHRKIMKQFNHQKMIEEFQSLSF
ncbi:uroporphyrinogen-III C-methyltransferase [Spongiivirga sp. MCCC 1A20706]|uniref:uroporphyrinogen-III C-methyltransferase n=1 Tax=Spongiivirga sp. MCCC 1A20706 TaxID=3160963 RepID=UPI00397782C5